MVLTVAAFAPIPLDLALRLVDAGSSWRGLAWMVVAASFVSLLLLSPGWAAERLAEQRPPLLRMLGADGVNDAADRASPAVAYLRDARRRLAVAGPTMHCVSSVASRPAPAMFRWAVRLPRIYIYPLVHVTRLRVIAHAPVSTPAIRDMAQLAADIALRANAGMFLVGLGLLWEVLSARSYTGHGVSHVEGLALVDLGPLAVTAAVAVYLSFARSIGSHRPLRVSETASPTSSRRPCRMMTRPSWSQTRRSRPAAYSTVCSPPIPPPRKPECSHDARSPSSWSSRHSSSQSC